MALIGSHYHLDVSGLINRILGRQCWKLVLLCQSQVMNGVR